MGTLPGNIVGDIEWFEQRVGSWAENAAAIGLTGAQTTTITTETTEARGAYNAAQAAKSAAKDATVTQNAEVSDMRSLGGQLITTIRAYAEQQPDPSAVYALASVPPPQSPVSVPPETPTDIAFELNNSGQIVVSWKGSIAGGTVFSLSRSLQLEPGEPFGPSEQIAIIGTKSFTDGSIPVCTVAAEYVITAYKGAFPPAVSKIATVRFTSGADGDAGNMRLVA